MKGKITAECVKRIKKLCRSKLNGGNHFSGSNAWAVGVVRYSAGIVDWADILSVDAGSLPRRNIYRKLQDKVALQVHWELCRKYVLERCKDMLYDYQPC